MIGTRKSYRIYTHALVVPAGHYPEGTTVGDYSTGEYQIRDVSGQPYPAEVHAYAGRLDLAEKQKRAHPDLIIVPVHSDTNQERA